MSGECSSNLCNENGSHGMLGKGIVASKVFSDSLGYKCISESIFALIEKQTQNSMLFQIKLWEIDNISAILRKNSKRCFSNRDEQKSRACQDRLLMNSLLWRSRINNIAFNMCIN